MAPWQAVDAAPDEVRLETIRGVLAIAVVHLFVDQRRGELQQGDWRRVRDGCPIDASVTVDVDVQIARAIGSADRDQSARRLQGAPPPAVDLAEFMRNPSCVPARHWYAEFLAEMGRFGEALAMIDRARIDDPLSRGIQASRAFVLWLGRRFDEAVADAQSVLDMDPTYPMALIRLGVSYEGKGRFADAVDVYRKAVDAAPDLLDSVGLLGHAYAKGGRADAARQQLEVLRRHAKRRYVPPFIFANVYVGLGDVDTAVRFIEQEYYARGWYLLLLRHAPRFDPLRSHAGFRAILEKIRFP